MNSTNFFCVLGSLSATAAVQSLSAQNALKPRPNVILIVADDLGFGDIGCNGCKDIPTPNIDKIARNGVRFTQAYAYNVSSPTRASLLTGCYAERSGINGVLMGTSVPQFSGATTLPEVLRASGYVTGLVGKWHLGYTDSVLPNRMGFDEFYGFHGGKIDYYKHTYRKPHAPSAKDDVHDFWENEKEIWPEGYATDLFTQKACQFIRRHANQPFFLELAYNAPHYPTDKGVYQAPDKYLKRFNVTGNPDNTRGGYAAMVSCMDVGIGLVLKELQKRNLEDNTIVMFFSDNGGELYASNAPYRGEKSSNWEGGVHIPLLACWKGVIPPGVVRNDVIHVMDLMPTLLSVTHSQAAKPLQFDGINAWPAFVGKDTLPEREVCFPNNAIRKGRWKLMGNKLFDLLADPAETNDVSHHYPEITQDLAGELKKWNQEVHIKK